MIKVHRLRAFSDNYIWLIGIEGSHLVSVVDPGDAGPVLRYLQESGLTLESILITHHHADHTGGVTKLLENYAVEVYGPGNERIPTITQPLSEGDEVALNSGENRFRVLETPGHTRGHICYVGGGALFCGDTLFTAGCGRLFEGSPEQMHHSLEKIATLPPETWVYCAHEYTLDNLLFAQIAEPDNPAIAARRSETEESCHRGEATVPARLSLELATNPFLRSGDAGLKSAAELEAGRTLASDAEVFAVVRRWKDRLD